MIIIIHAIHMFVGLEFIDINLYTDKVPMVERINIKNKDNKIHIRLTVEYIFSIKSFGYLLL